LSSHIWTNVGSQTLLFVVNAYLISITVSILLLNIWCICCDFIVSPTKTLHINLVHWISWKWSNLQFSPCSLKIEYISLYLPFPLYSSTTSKSKVSLSGLNLSHLEDLLCAYFDYKCLKITPSFLYLIQ